MTDIAETIRQLLAAADALDARNADHPCPSWSDGVEARRLRLRASMLSAGMI